MRSDAGPRPLSLYLRGMLLFGPPIGIVLGILFGLGAWMLGSGDALLQGVIGAVAATLVAGGALSGVLVTRHIRKARLAGAPSLAVRHEATVDLAVGAKEAKARALAALAALARAGEPVWDKDAHTALVTTGLSYDSFGEQVSVRIEAGGSGTRLVIVSEPVRSGTITDGGLNHVNVETLRQALSESEDDALPAV